MRNWGGTWLDSLTRLLSVYGWGCGHLKTRMGLQGPCHGWLLSRSLRAPLRNARVSSGQGFRLQPELLVQGRSSECLMASLRSPAVTLPQVLTGQRPATTHAGGAWPRRWRTTGCLGSWRPGDPHAMHGPIPHLEELALCGSYWCVCSVTSVLYYSLQPHGR